MPIFEKNGVKILLVHIPKTGGTSLEHWLKKETTMSFFSPIPPGGLMICPQHLQVGSLKVLLGGALWHWACAIVRNPYDRMESEYFWRTDEQFKNLGVRPDFSTWVINNIRAAKQNPYHLDNHLRPQTDFIDTEVKIFKFEEGLALVVHELSEQLSIDIPVDFDIVKLNASDRQEVNWSVEALNLANSHYKNDFIQLKYQKKAPKLEI